MEFLSIVRSVFSLDALIYLAIAVTDIIKVKSGKRQQELQKEQQASKERLSDPEYAKALKELGYEVPEAYLPEED